MADIDTELHRIAANGKFSGIVTAINSNFDLLRLAILAKRDGLSAYEVWLNQEGNEGKSIDDFWAFLTADKGYTKQVLTYAEFQALDPTTVSRSTIYVHPNSTNTEYYAKVSNGNIWVELLRNNGDISDFEKIKEALLKSSSPSAVRLAVLEKGAIVGTSNTNIAYDTSTASTIRIRSKNSFLTTGSSVSVVAKSLSGNYYTKITQYNACDSNGTSVAICSGSEDKLVFATSVSNVNIGVYVRFVIRVYTDSELTTPVDEITDAILNDIYVSSEDSVGLKFDNTNSSLKEYTEDEYYIVGEIDERLKDIEDVIPSMEEDVEQLLEDTNGIVAVKEALAIPNEQVVKKVILERGGIDGIRNTSIDYEAVSGNGKRIRSVGKFLTTASSVKVVAKSASGSYYPMISQYNACDSNGTQTKLFTAEDSKNFYNPTKSNYLTAITNVVVGVYVRFVIKVFSDAAHNTLITDITDDILADIYIDNTDSQGVTFDNDNSTAESSEYYNVSELEERISAIEREGMSPVHDAITEEITISVNGTKPSQDFSTLNTNPDNDDFYDITGKLWIPKSNNKCKLVISFPGGGGKLDSWYGYMNHGAILNALGYAVYIPTGYSIAWYNAHGVNSGYAPIGSWMAQEEVTKGYQYIMERYGSYIDGNCVFAYGESQGGMVAENAMEQSGIPFKGGVLDAPAISMQYAQMYLSSRASCVEALYGLSNHVFDKTKCIGCDPFTRNMSEDIVMTESENFSTKPTIDISLVTAKKFRSTNCPLFVMVGNNDVTVSPYVQKAYAKAVINAGEWCKLKVYDCGHGVIQYTSVIGTCEEKNITVGLADVLSFFKRCGGYDYEIALNEE